MFGLAPRRRYIMELLLLSSSLFQGAAVSGETGDPARKPLLRQEQPPRPSALEISSRGSSLGRGRRHQHTEAHGKTLNHGSQVMMPSGTFEESCVDYPKNLDSPVADDHAMCDGSECQAGDHPEAQNRCCNCNAGAQFHIYADTQCTGESGTSKSNPDGSMDLYEGKRLLNPEHFDDVKTCMDTCWAMGDECTAISVVNEGSDYGGQCWFRKGNLEYVNAYSSCYQPTCETRVETADNTIQMTTPKPENNDTRLPMCEDVGTMEDIECTTDPKLARPMEHTTPAPAAKSVDEVVDKRDCFVKYLWFEPSKSDD